MATETFAHDEDGWQGDDELGTDQGRARPAFFGTQQRLALPARLQGDDDAPHTRRKTTRAAAVEHTMSFEATAAPAANLRASRLLKARVKVNSTRQGTPRPTGPWSPGALQRAAELKGNESEEVAPNIPVWPRSADDTMEYQAFAALSKPTVPIEPAFIARPRAGDRRLQRSPLAPPAPAPDKLTVPVTPAPDLVLTRHRHDLAHRVDATLERAAVAFDASLTIEVPARDRHVPEKIMTLVLLATSALLIWLNLS